MQATPTVLSQILASLGPQSPVILALIAGLIVAAINLPRHRTPATWAAVGIGLQLFTIFVGAVAHGAIMSRIYSGDGPSSSTNVAWMFTALGLGTSLFRAFGLGLMIAAIFVGRGEPAAGGAPFAK